MDWLERGRGRLSTIVCRLYGLGGGRDVDLDGERGPVDGVTGDAGRLRWSEIACVGECFSLKRNCSQFSVSYKRMVSTWPARRAPLSFDR